MNAILLIPIFEPQERTERFFEQLRKEVTNPIVIVDDGSGEKYRKTFERLVSRDLRVTLLRYSENKGKGYALKYGIRFIQKNIRMHPGSLPRTATASMRSATSNACSSVFPRWLKMCCF